MMEERQAEFRRAYRSQIAGWYNGYLHILVIYTIGVTAIYVYVHHISFIIWWEWFTVPVVILLCNLFEWYLHQHVMHRLVKVTGLRAIYERHTLNHHRFFTDGEMRFRDQKDWRVTVFPPYALVVFILLSIPAGLVVGYIVSSNVGWLLMCSTTGMYLTYEFMHFCCHVDENAFVRFCPLVNTLRRHHTAHHNNKLMTKVNLNLTFPISDWLFGTSDLERGLFGHLFNGYSTEYLKSNLKSVPKGPLEAASGPVPVE
ncbi:MAG: fatty acid hydroxylase [Magnetovibrio sp.]|nr:fatty acid hydroxylase [Magnetovibrio sp.]|tara:strand:- start:449 stop:1219 length:771 start_codon:yes stop_codon:yes gene_type:complete